MTAFGKRGGFGGGDIGYLLSFDLGLGDGVIFYEHSDGANDWSLRGTKNLNDGEWHHIAIVVERNNENNSFAYVDTLDDTSARGGTPPTGSISNTSEFFVIGANGSGHVNKFTGQIADLRVYNRYLSFPEIQLLNAYPYGDITPWWNLQAMGSRAAVLAAIRRQIIMFG